jgi:polyhydroxyalkanoate synthase
MPLLNFFGQYDHLVPPEACNQLTRAVGSKDVEDVCLETGHIGIYVSSRFQKMFAPKIVRWLKDRDSENIVDTSGNASVQKMVKRKPQKHQILQVKKKVSAGIKKSTVTAVSKKKSPLGGINKNQ